MLIRKVGGKDMVENFLKEGPSNHGAKQKAFVTVPAWPVYLLLRSGKPPSSIGGLFLPFKSGRGEGDERGI
jgi:hypothetical protein